VFGSGFRLVRDRIEARLYPNVSAFIADMRSVLRSPSADPQLIFDVQITRYVLPQITPSLRPLDEEDVMTIGGKIMDALEDSFKKALKKQEELWDEMEEQPAKRPQLLEQFNGTTFDNSIDVTSGSLPNSPSIQLVKEALPEPLKNGAPIYEPPNLAQGGTIIGDLTKTIAEEWIVGPISTAARPWRAGIHSASATGSGGVPAAPGEGNDKQVSHCLSPATDVANSPSVEKPNGTLPAKPGDNIADQDHKMEDAPADDQMEDASLDPEQELPPDVSSPTAPTPLKTYDGGAKGGIGGEIAAPDTAQGVPEVISRVRAIAASTTENVSDVDSMYNDLATGDHLAITTPSTVVSLPDLPPNDGPVDLEALSNTSALSDYPDDLDENANVGVGADSVKKENDGEGENEKISPPAKGRKSAREANGRFGSTGAGTARRKKR